MTTKEVEELLGLTKQTLIYYEKEGLIKPSRDMNNYRNYSQEDVDLLRYIQLLRSMELCIDEIKLIIDGKLSLRKALETKRKYIEKERIELDNIEKRINDYIKRRRVYVSFDDEEVVYTREEWNDELIDHLYLNDNHIRYGDIILNLNDIEYIDISMCSYLRSVSFNIHSQPYEYHVDIDIHTNDDIYLFEIFNYKKNLDVFKYFDDHSLKTIDVLSLKELYMSKNIVEATRFLQYNFKEFAKKYNLDNPRGSFFQEHMNVIKKNSEKTISLNKNIFHSLFKKKEK